MSQCEAVKQELEQLLADGLTLLESLKKDDSSFQFDYQSWYTQAVRVVEIALPDRVAEFRSYYEIDPKRKSLSYGTYVIQDFFKNIVPSRSLYQDFNSSSSASRCLVNQIGILQSVRSRLESVIDRIQQTILADVRDLELEAAQQLQKVSLRAAGALAGVVLERHLQQTANNHKLESRKKRPTLSDHSEALKQAAIIDVSAWRKLSYLADIRNICCHNKGDDPTAEQVKELIDGVNWALKIVL